MIDIKKAINIIATTSGNFYTGIGTQRTVQVLSGIPRTSTGTVPVVGNIHIVLRRSFRFGFVLPGVKQVGIVLG